MSSASALLRSRSPGKVVVSTASAAGVASAAPTPCNARAAMIGPAAPNSAASKAELPKIPVPTTYIRRRPNRSAMRPPRRTNPANVIE